jgi:LysM repeat protein
MSENEQTETVVEEAPPPNEPQPQEVQPEEDFQNRGELVKFGVLALVLLGAVLIVALTRPLIFGHVVPAIMGDGRAPDVVEPLPPADSVPDEDTAVDQTDDADTDPEVDDASDSSSETFIPAIGGPDTTETEDEAAEDEAETAVIRYTVRPSDNLTKIAEQHGVTVQAIITLNNITNPNRIEAGTVLQIPAPQSDE